MACNSNAIDEIVGNPIMSFSRPMNLDAKVSVFPKYLGKQPTIEVAGTVP